jgi:hypothetical protein
MLQIIETHKIQFLILKDMTMQKFPCYAVDYATAKISRMDFQLRQNSSKVKI